MIYINNSSRSPVSTRAAFPVTTVVKHPKRFVCARQLKWVRKQFNEYETMKRTLLYMTIVLVSYGVVVLYLLADDAVTVRRVAIFCEKIENIEQHITGVL